MKSVVLIVKFNLSVIYWLVVLVRGFKIMVNNLRFILMSKYCFKFFMIIYFLIVVGLILLVVLMNGM